MPSTESFTSRSPMGYLDSQAPEGGRAQSHLRPKTIFKQSLMLAHASIKARYRNSFSGYLWVVLSPLIMFVTQAYVFKVIFKVETENYILFLLFGLSPWLFFSQTVEMSTGLLYHQARILKSLRVSPLTLLLAQALDNFVNSMVVMTLALIAVASLGLVPWSALIFFPLPYFTLLLAVLFLSFLLSVCQVFFFDTRFVVGFALNILYFVSPIVYPENFVPAKYRFILAFNPLTYLLRPFRTLLAQGFSREFLQDEALALAFAFILMMLTLVVWRKSRDAFYFRL